MIAAAAMGDPNASIPTPQPVHFRHMFGAYGKANDATSVLFVSEAANANGLGGSLGLTRKMVSVKNCRTVRKQDLIHNTMLPNLEVDPETYEVRADGVLLTCEPATILPLAQRYSLF